MRNWLRIAWLTVPLAPALAGPATAQAERPFPLHPTPSPAPELVVLTPDDVAIVELAGLHAVRLSGLRGPDGVALNLLLERIDLGRLRLGFHVDGLPRPDLLAGQALSVWRGHVVGEPRSGALLAFGPHGNHGWIDRPGGRLHLVVRPGARGAGESWLADDRELARRGLSPPAGCGVDGAPQGPAQAPALPVLPGQPISLGSPCGLRECKVAVESDYQLFQRFGDLGAMAAYVGALLAAVSDVYERQVGTVLTFPYIGFYTDPNDPWVAQDNGGTIYDLYNEFRTAWIGNLPAGARLAHFLSGANMPTLGPGGIAGVDALCSDTSNFGVSTAISGTATFPVPLHPTNWDFYLVAHELGHNFGALHTHQYCPPIDQCANQPNYGPCQAQQVCGTVGTLMSYCNLCAGGFANIRNEFHPQIAAVMQGRAAACLPDYGGWIAADGPARVAPGESAPVTAVVSTVPMGAVELHTRVGGGPWTVTALAHQGALTYAGTLPPVGCGGTLEWFARYGDAECGPVSDPLDAPLSTFSPLVGAPVVVLADDFELDRGWTATNLGATSGDWERGIPVDDPSWIYDPPGDADGSGRAWLTWNALGQTGVRNGAVRLTSPALDLAAGAPEITYSYWLRLQHQNGSDYLRVEASDNGLAGPWVVVAEHVWNGHVWRTHTIHAEEFLALGLQPSADTRLRFTANESSPLTAVEAGLDAFVASVFTCVEPLPVAYCEPAGANSVSPSGARLAHVAGVPGHVLSLRVEDVPAQPGIFFFGPNQVDLPFGCGRRCVGGAVLRSAVQQPAGTSFEAQLDTTSLAPTPFRIQYWYRDPAAAPSCGAGFNLSNALAY